MLTHGLTNRGDCVILIVLWIYYNTYLSFVSSNRNNCEKLTFKLKEQAKNIVQLNSEKEKHINENEALKQQLKRMKESLETGALDKEKIKVLKLLNKI